MSNVVKDFSLVFQNDLMSLLTFIALALIGIMTSEIFSKPKQTKPSIIQYLTLSCFIGMISFISINFFNKDKKTFSFYIPLLAGFLNRAILGSLSKIRSISELLKLFSLIATKTGNIVLLIADLIQKYRDGKK